MAFSEKPSRKALPPYLLVPNGWREQTEPPAWDRPLPRFSAPSCPSQGTPCLRGSSPQSLRLGSSRRSGRGKSAPSAGTAAPLPSPRSHVTENASQPLVRGRCLRGEAGTPGLSPVYLPSLRPPPLPRCLLSTLHFPLTTGNSRATLRGLASFCPPSRPATQSRASAPPSPPSDWPRDLPLSRPRLSAQTEGGGKERGGTSWRGLAAKRHVSTAPPPLLGPAHTRLYFASGAGGACAENLRKLRLGGLPS